MQLKIRKKIQQIKATYKSVFYIEEDMIIDVIMAITIASKMKGDPIWLLIIGGPSSGKSELCQSINKVPFVYPVSTLSENTWLSNMPSRNGEETSLLHRIGPSGIVTMKDYTSVLSMRPERRETIVSQMREIYDGFISKEAGNGNSQKWEGKINWIGAVTESAYLKEGDSASMGRRTINYIMPSQDRKLTTKRAVQNNKDIDKKREKIQDLVAETIQYVIENFSEEELPEISENLTEKLIDLSDFVTAVRSPTERNFKGDLVLVPSQEMPMRVFQMFLTLARILVLLNDNEECDQIDDILFKIAMDSIPKQRMLTLKLLAKYPKMTTKGAAQELRYPTETMRAWLEDTNVLGICERVTDKIINGVRPDFWVMNEPYRSMMIQYNHIEVSNEDLHDEDEMSDGSNNQIQPAWILGMTDDPGYQKELDKNSNELFDSM